MAWSTSTHRGSTRLSRTLRAHVLTLHPVCYLNYPGCTVHSTEDDHVIPLSQGGTDHITNHRGVCATCHKRKTHTEAQAGQASRQRPTEQHPGLIT